MHDLHHVASTCLDPQLGMGEAVGGGTRRVAGLAGGAREGC